MISIIFNLVKTAVLLLTLVLFGILSIPPAEAKNGPPCPHFITLDGPDTDTQPDQVPTIPAPKTSECYLNRDVNNLLKPLALNSDILLDCRGHKITPAALGVLGNPTTRSQPEVAIYLNGAHNTQIKDCHLEGFDQGILSINSKVPPELKGDPDALVKLRNRILGNKITARFIAIHLAVSDNFDIEGNNLTWVTQGGAGVYIQNDSDLNEIQNNVVTGDFVPDLVKGAVLFPGPTPPVPAVAGQPNFNTNPVFSSGHGGIVLVQVLGTLPHLFNAVIDGKLYQFEDSNALSPDESFTADNLIENNVVTYVKYDQPNNLEDGITTSATLRTTIRGNTMGISPLEGGPDGGRRGSIRAGGIGPVAPQQYPGRCSLSADRKCLTDFDCNISGVDAASLGTCSNIPSPIFATWFAQDWIAENNIIYSPFHFGIGLTANDSIVRDNEIEGPFLSPTAVSPPQAAIILQGKFPTETAVVTGNHVGDCATALRLEKGFGGLTAGFFGEEVRRNNFTGYTVAARTSNDFAFNAPVDLSSGGEGNYWGLICEAGGFDAAKVLRVNNTVNLNVGDGHPYGEPVDENSVTCF